MHGVLSSAQKLQTSELRSSTTSDLCYCRLEEAKFVLGGASVACVVSHRCQIFMVLA